MHLMFMVTLGYIWFGPTWILLLCYYKSLIWMRVTFTYFLYWLFHIWYDLLIRVVCLMIGFLEDLIQLYICYLIKLERGTLVVMSMFSYLKFDTFLLALNELGHSSLIGCCLHNWKLNLSTDIYAYKMCVIASNSCLSLTHQFYIGSCVTLMLFDY